MLDSKGTEITIGDTVRFENGSTAGVITHILESPSDLKAWAVGEPGVMVESEPFGSVFLPASSFVTDELQIVSA